MNRLDPSVNHWNYYEVGKAMGLQRNEINALANKDVEAILKPLVEVSHEIETKLGFNQSRSDQALSAGRESVCAVLQQRGYDNIWQAIDVLGVAGIKQISDNEGAKAVRKKYEIRLDPSVNHWNYYEVGKAIGLQRNEMKSLANKELNAILKPLTEVSHEIETKLGFNQFRSDQAIKVGKERVVAVLKERGYVNIWQAFDVLGVAGIKTISDNEGAKAVREHYER